MVFIMASEISLAAQYIKSKVINNKIVNENPINKLSIIVSI